MSNEIKIDASQVYNLFKDLDSKKQGKVLKEGLRRASGIISRETKKNLKQKMGAKATKITQKKKESDEDFKKRKPLIQGIKVSVKKQKNLGAETYTSKVHIMGDYRLKWFEMGTKERVWRRDAARRTGTIKPLYFFKNAVEAKEEKANQSLQEYLTKAIMKIYNKK